MLPKTITSDFFTTISLRQAFQSLYLMTFWLYKLRYWKDKELFEQELLEYLWKKGKKMLSFYNGRNAIYHCLKLIWVQKEDEVIINAYTCSVVVNAVKQSWVRVVYSDVESKTLSFDYEVLKKNISSKTKVIILQHTFWMQARDYSKIIDLAQEKGIIIIEDCALNLGNKTKIKWDFAIFSTGRDKVISSVTGWFLLINNLRFVGSEYFHSSESKLKMPSRILTFQNLNYNIVWYKSYKMYDFFKLWRVIIFISRKLKLITEVFPLKEKNFEHYDFNLAFPNSLAYLARKELKKLDWYSEIRLEKAIEYICSIKNDKIELLFKIVTEDIYNGFRIPILLKSQEQSEKLYNYMRNNNVLLWKAWSWINIVPVWTDFEKAWYISGSCTIAEDISKRILFLPNHNGVNTQDIKRVVELINNFKL